MRLPAWFRRRPYDPYGETLRRELKQAADSADIPEWARYAVEAGTERSPFRSLEEARNT